MRKLGPRARVRSIVRIFFLALLVAATARADNTVPAAPSTSRLHCRWQDTAYGHAVHSPEVERAQKQVPPGVYFMQIGRRHILFGDDWPGKKPRSVVYSRDEKKIVLDVPQAPASLVETREGALAGLLLVEKNGLAFVSARARDLAPTRVVLGPVFGNSASVVLDGDECTAWIALFHRIATGSALVSVDLCTGALRWTADVQQLNVAHSKYFSDVTVEKRADEIVLTGVEAGGCYEQVFDAATGRRKRVTLGDSQP
jgi:hypothetical protein